MSVFLKGENGVVYHTYSTYARGLDILNGAYRYPDLVVPKGRDEELCGWYKRVGRQLGGGDPDEPGPCGSGHVRMR